MDSQHSQHFALRAQSTSRDYSTLLDCSSRQLFGFLRPSLSCSATKASCISLVRRFQFDWLVIRTFNKRDVSTHATPVMVVRMLSRSSSICCRSSSICGRSSSICGRSNICALPSGSRLPGDVRLHIRHFALQGNQLLTLHKQDFGVNLLTAPYFSGAAASPSSLVDFCTMSTRT